MIKYLSQILNEEDTQLLASIFSMKKFKSKEFFTIEGKRSNKIGFINTGLSNSFYIDEQGEKQTVCFSTEQMWVFDPISYFTEAKCRFSIQFLEDSTVSIAIRDDIEKLCEVNQNINTVLRKMIEQSYVFMLDRIITKNTQTARERYLTIMKEYPDIFQRIPLKLIASYIGITESSLSRIRANINK